MFAVVTFFLMHKNSKVYTRKGYGETGSSLKPMKNCVALGKSCSGFQCPAP